MVKPINILIENYQNSGNESYFEELCKLFQPLIKKYAKKIYYLDYDDSVQELTIALYEAVKKIKSTDNEYSCISYIKKAIINKFCRLYYLSEETQSNQEITISFDCEDYRNFDSGYNEENCIYSIDLENQLKAKNFVERSTIFLIIYGYSDEEIGKRLGYSRQYINRLKKKILI